MLSMLAGMFEWKGKGRTRVSMEGKEKGEVEEEEGS